MKVGGVVLCGGRSTRMGSPKALLPFGPETMLQRIVRLLATVASPVVVVSSAGQQLPSLPTDVLLASDEREGTGPLEGLRAGLRALHTDTAAAYLTACDAPLLVPALVSRLVALLNDHDAAALDVDGVLHPLSAIYRPTVLPHIDALLLRGQAGPAALLDLINTRRVQPSEVLAEDPDLLTLRNVNTEREYREALSLAGIAVGE